jgi:hypothetical protein
MPTRVKLDAKVPPWASVIVSIKVEIRAKDNKSDIYEPGTKVKIRISARCIEYGKTQFQDGGHQEHLKRVFTIKDGKLWWPHYKKEYVAVNAQDVVDVVTAAVDKLSG